MRFDENNTLKASKYDYFAYGRNSRLIPLNPFHYALLRSLKTNLSKFDVLCIDILYLSSAFRIYKIKYCFVIGENIMKEGEDEGLRGIKCQPYFVI